jgi:hypothetical protein
MTILFMTMPLQHCSLKVVTSEKIGGSGVTSTLGTWYGGVVMGVLLSIKGIVQPFELGGLTILI